MKKLENKLIRITTVPLSLDKLLSGQLNYVTNFYDVTAVSSDEEYLQKIGNKENIKTFPIEMSRKITPIQDLVSLVKLFLFLKKVKPLIVHSHTPKAGILAMIASKCAGVPIRLHTIAGLPLMETNGLKRTVLERVEKSTYWCATRVYPNSKGLYDFILSNKFTEQRKLKIIGNGSSNGINTTHFAPNQVSQSQLDNLKKALGILSEDFVFVFIGRLVGDKGINEVVRAFKKIIQQNSCVKLLLVGMQEKDLDPLEEWTQDEINTNKNILFVGYQDEIRPFLAISKALVFASYREGFPNVVLQAGAMGLPAIVTNINGSNEIIKDGKNGIIIPVKNKEAIEKAVFKLIQEKDFFISLQSNAREMITSRFEQKVIWKAILEEYKLEEKKHNTSPKWNQYKNGIKPVFDFGFAFLGFLAVSPILCVTTFYLFVSNKGNIFFLQKRPGLDGKIFTIIKFKTMNDKKDAQGNLLPDSERLTKIGKWIRKTSIDELPQLLNVLKGEMSMVGPRPLLPEYINLYTDFQKRRHLVKPGITGLAQINGRNAIDWETKFKYDVRYVEQQSFWIDFKIIFYTIIKVLKFENINSINNATIVPFYGK